MSNVTLLSIKISGKSWKVAGENGLSHRSINEPGGGGARLSYQSEAVEEHVSTVLSLSHETLESLFVDESPRLGTSKRESSAETTLSLSGADGSVIS